MEQSAVKPAASGRYTLGANDHPTIYTELCRSTFILLYPMNENLEILKVQVNGPLPKRLRIKRKLVLIK